MPVSPFPPWTSGGAGHTARASLPLVLALLSGCSGVERSSPTAPSTREPQFALHESTALTFRYTTLDASTIAQTAAAIEDERARLMTDLGVTDMPRVVVTLYPAPASLRAGVASLVGAIPAFASGLVTGVDAIHILSPNLSSAWLYPAGVAGIVHELAHCVSMRLNPGIPNNPRWLWESVALYEARQFIDPRAIRPLVGPVTLGLLNDMESTYVYDVGATIGEFIVQTWGRSALRALIQTNGNLAQVVGLSDEQFVARWMEFSRDR